MFSVMSLLTVARSLTDIQNDGPQAIDPSDSRDPDEASSHAKILFVSEFTIVGLP